MSRPFSRSPLALEILTLLHEAPMHPYHMQRLIKERGKDQVINVAHRASLYQTVDQLLRAGLIAVRQTSSQEGFPERTIYRLTEKGHETAVAWLHEMLSMPAQEFPEFPAAVSLLPLLPPEDAARQLELRAVRLADQIAFVDRELQSSEAGLARLFLLESEYQQVVLEAELKWVRTVIADLQGGRLTWSGEWAHPFEPPEGQE